MLKEIGESGGFKSLKKLISLIKVKGLKIKIGY